MKADFRSEGDAALAALAAERKSLGNVRDRRTGTNPPRRGPAPCGPGAMGRAPSGARLRMERNCVRNRESRESRRNEEARESLISCIDYERITDPAELFSASIECERGVLWKESVQRFALRRALNCAELSRELRDGSYRKRPAQHFLLHERGKARRISAVRFRDRVVQKSLCRNSLIPLLSRGLIYDNSATLEGRGTEFARTRFAKHLRRAWGRWGSAGYLVHYDFKSYFASIDQRRAMGRLETKLLGICRNDEEMLSARRVLWLARQFICEEDRGLGLGNQTSQIVAVEYASPIDHMICEVLRLGLSGRYMDDGYAFCPDGDAARVALGAIESKAASIGLALHPQKCGIEPVGREHVFLKYKFRVDARSGQVAMAPVVETLRRYRRRHLRLCRLAAAGAVGMDAVEASEASFRGVVKLATEGDRLEAEMATAFARNRGLAGLDGLA